MRVPRLEPEGEGPAGLLEHHVLRPRLPAPGQRPVVQAKVFDATAAGPTAGVAEIRLGRAEMVPIGLRLDALPLDRHGIALDVEQPLDAALRLLVASLAEVLVADTTIL